MTYFEIPIEKLPHRNVADVLLITATPTETERVHEQLDLICDGGILKVNDNNRQIYYLGKCNGYNVVHCQCGSMGTQGEKSSILTTSEAIQTWSSIKCVIMVGIAFGMYEEDGQRFSDVLVASKIYPYENQRLNKDNSIDYRGEFASSNQKLLDAFSVVSDKWKWNNLSSEKTKIEICPLLSGEKLVDNLSQRNKLKSSFPDCRGGEMEGIGIASVCKRYEKPWILLKGICDFADGNKGENKKEKQKDAASAAIHACMMAFNTDNFASLIGEKIEFRYSDEDIDLNKVFFVHYDVECEPYYIVRQLDSVIFPYLKKKSCWVHGKSGIGKSELLTRNLLYNNLNVVYVDLSLCDKSDSDIAFTKIYDSICDSLGHDSEQNLPYEELIKAMAKLLNDKFSHGYIYLLIDEIPYSDKQVFSSFVDKVCAMIKFIGRNFRTVNVYFMLSSIVSPLEILGDINVINKYSQHIKFIEIGDWSFDECHELIDRLANSSGLKIREEMIEKLITHAEFSPRTIKKVLQEARAIDVFEINEAIINQLT